MTDKICRVLLVDDEYSLREPLADFLRAQYNFDVDTAASQAGAWQQVEQAEAPYDVVLIDDMLLENEIDPEAFPMSVGIDLLTQIKQYAPHTECILFTGWSGTERGLEALRAGAYRFMKKPFDHEELAMTIQMAAQHHQLKQDFVMADQQKRWLKTFMKIGQATTSIHSLDEVLAEVHRQVGELMDVTEMDIVLYDEETQILSFELCYDRGEKQEKWKRPFGEGFTEWVITQKQPFLMEHYDKQKTTLPAIASLVFFDEKKDEVTQSYLGVPLIARGKVIGVINVQSYNANQFDDTDMYVLSAIASQVANAIQNARLFSDLYETRERRQALLQSSLDAIVAIDNKKHITVFNKEAEKFSGYSAAEVLGKKTSLLFEDIEVGRQIFDELDGDVSVSERQINFKHKNGQPLPSLLSATVIKDEAGKAIGQAGFIRDLREVRLLEARQRAWFNVSKAVTQSQELSKILELIMQSVTCIIPTATGGEFHLYKDGVLQLAANTFNFSDDATAAFSLKVGQGIAGNVFESKKCRIVTDTLKDSYFKTFNHPEAPTYRSMICVPLQVQDQLLGTLSLTSEVTYAFKKAGIALLTPFASQAAIAIKNRQLLGTANEGIATLKSISEASRNLISQQEPETVLQAIVEEAKKALHAWRVSIILIDPDGCPHELAAIGYEHALNIETIIRRKTGLSAQVMESMKPCFIENVRKSSEDLNDDMQQDCVLAAACLPLKLGVEAIGVLWIQYKQPHAFTLTEKEAMVIYSDHATLALKNANLLEQVKKARDTAHIVANVTTLETENVLGLVAQGMVDAVNCDAVTLYVYDEQNDTLSYPPTTGGQIMFPLKTNLKSTVSKDSIVLKLLNKNPLIVNDTANNPLFCERRFTVEEGIKSLMTIPLKCGKEKVGIMFVNYRQLHILTRDERQNIELFANQAAIAIRNIQLYEQVQKRVGMFQALHKANIAISSPMSSKKTLSAILEQAVNIINHSDTEVGFACVRKVENGISRLLATYPPVLDEKTKSNLALEVKVVNSGNKRIGIIGRAALTGKIQRENDVSNNPDYREELPNIKSELAVPYKLQDATIVIDLQHQERNFFTQADEKAIKVLAAQAANAIDNAELYQESVTFREVAESLSKTNKLDDIFEIVIQAGMKLVDTPIGGITFWDTQKKYSTDMVWNNGELNRYPSVTRKNGLTQQILENHKTIVTPDKRLADNPNPVYKERGFLAEVGVPIENQEQVLGVLYACHSSVHHFSKRQVEMLEMLGKQAGVAIVRAMDFERMKHLKGFIGNQTAVEWIQMVSTTWGHSLKREVGIAKGRAKLLSTLSSSEDRNEFEEELNSLEKVLERIANLPITAPLTYEDVTKTITINNLLRTYLTRQWTHAQYKEILLTFDLQSKLDELTSVWASPEWLRRGFELIIDNAIWAMKEVNTPNPEVTVSTCLQDSQIIITFENNGPTISDEVLDRFSKRLAIPKSDGDRGSGIGLQLTKTIFETYRGSMQMYKRKPKGTKVLFTLPTYQPDKGAQQLG